MKSICQVIQSPFDCSGQRMAWHHPIHLCPTCRSSHVGVRRCRAPVSGRLFLFGGARKLLCMLGVSHSHYSEASTLQLRLAENEHTSLLYGSTETYVLTKPRFCTA